MKKSSVSTLLTVLGVIGVAATAIVAVKNAPKAQYLLEEAELDKGEKLTKLEKVKVAAPAYIPAIAVGTATVACVVGANVMNKHIQASMASAYALLDSSYKAYRKKVEDIHGEGSDEEILAQMAKDEYEQELIDDIPEGELLFWDPNSRQYFVSTVDHVLQKTELEDGMECYILTTPFDVPWNW